MNLSQTSFIFIWFAYVNTQSILSPNRTYRLKFISCLKLIIDERTFEITQVIQFRLLGELNSLNFDEFSRKVEKIHFLKNSVNKDGKNLWRTRLN